MRMCKTHRQCQHTHNIIIIIISSSSIINIIIIAPSSHHHHHHHLTLPPLWPGAFCTLGCKTHRNLPGLMSTHIIIIIINIIITIIIILPSPLWNGAFCTLGCKTHGYIPWLMSTYTHHHPLGMERSVHWGVKHTDTHQGGGSTPSHGETIPLGGVPPHWQNLEPEHIYDIAM